MNRRLFLQSLAASIAATGLSHIPAFASQPSWKLKFHQALKKNPWLLGFQTAQKTEYLRQPLKVSGNIPKGLQGSLYRNGPARHEIGDDRYHHWFDGDGMVHQYKIEGQEVWHQARFVVTEKYASEQDNVMRIQSFGTVLPSMQRPTSPDAINVANINIIEHNGELLALWEGGSAYRIDADSLSTLGLKYWDEDTSGAPFSAHPRREQDGTLWNFGYSARASALILYHISPTGAVKKTGLMPMNPASMVHDFMVTENYLVFILPPFHFSSKANQSFIDQFDWKDQDGEVLIVSKQTFQVVSRYSIPSFWVFHYGNAYESAKNEIRFQAPIYNDPGAMTHGFRVIMRGEASANSLGKLANVTLNWANETCDISMPHNLEAVEFPVIDPRDMNHNSGNLFLAHNQRDHTKLSFDSVVSVNDNTSQIYQYDSKHLVEEHVFVPDLSSSKKGAGWLIGTALDYGNQQHVLSIFDANNLSIGPLAQARINETFPIGLHGSFVAKR